MSNDQPVCRLDRRPLTNDQQQVSKVDCRRSSFVVRRSTLVLGLGNPLQGDDGVGIRVIEALEQRELPAHVEVVDGGTPGLGLINLLEGHTHVIIVDAAEMGRQPGEVVRFHPEEVKLTGSSARFSLHRTAVADALALANELDLPMPEIVVYGVQPKQVDWSEELSDPVKATIPGLIEAILKETQE